MDANSEATRRSSSPPGRLAFALLLAQRSLSEFFADRCAQLAASIAYHVLFSLFPLAIVVTGGFALVAHDSSVRNDVVDAIVRDVPLSAQGSADVRRLLEGATGALSSVGLVGVVGLVWAASGMMAAVRTGLNAAWDVEQARPFLKGKLVDVGLVLAASIGALASIAATVGVRAASSALSVGVDLTSGWAAWLLAVAFPLATAFATVFGLYRLIPATRVPVSPTWLAALAVAGAFVALQNVFAVYLENFAHYNAVYGSLGAVIAFMFFVYLSAALFLLGAEVASEWPRLRHAVAIGAVEPGPPMAEQARQFVRGLWVAKRHEEASREQDRLRANPPARERHAAVGRRRGG